jgi:toxin ParE1/3/4
MIKYRLTNEAKNDLEKIWIYTYENFSIKQADKYYRLIIDEFEFIASNPYSGKSVDHIKEGYRVSKVKSHLVFYKLSIDEKIEIIRILHQRMDIEIRIR